LHTAKKVLVHSATPYPGEFVREIKMRYEKTTQVNGIS